MDATNYLTASKGARSWLLSLDHKRIGIMYLCTVTCFFFLAGLFALLVRLELFKLGGKDGMILSANSYNQAFTYHGVIMTFLVVIPLIPGVIGNFILPVLVGAKDVAFPRLNLLSYYFYLAGGLIAASSLFIRGLDTGWTFYVPYSIRSQTTVSLVLLGAFTAGFSSILTGLNFIVTIHTLRAKGMSFTKMPLFCWGSYATSVIQILATPVLAITLLLLMAERMFKIGIFDPALGGDPVLFQHFFWFYSHPAVYIMILPAMGVISEIIPVFSRKKIFGYKAIALSSAGIAAVGFIVWGHHMFISGQSSFANYLFSLLTMLVGVPTGVKVFSWILTMYRGALHLNAPMLYAIGFLELFVIGGLTGIFLATVGIDVHLTDTYFVVAHFHYVMVGGSLMAFLGGMHFWFPKMFGRMYSERSAKVGFFLILLGFNLTFFPQFVLGAQGMPRRYWTFVPEFLWLNRTSTVGSWFLGLGFLHTAVSLIRAAFKGPKAIGNPWGSMTLEWTSSSPLPLENFDEAPVVTHGPYDYDLALPSMPVNRVLA